MKFQHSAAILTERLNQAANAVFVEYPGVTVAPCDWSCVSGPKLNQRILLNDQKY
jgi:hypothetical protein